MRFRLVEAYTEEEISLVIRCVKLGMDILKKPVALKDIRIMAGRDPSTAGFNQLHDSSIIDIIKNNARDITIRNRNKGVYFL